MCCGVQTLHPRYWEVEETTNGESDVKRREVVNVFNGELSVSLDLRVTLKC